MVETKVELKNGNSYTIHIGRGFNALPSFLYGKLKKYDGEKVFIITDTNVEVLYLKEFEDLLKAEGFNVAGKHAIKASEESKTLQSIYEIYESMVDASLDRKSIVIALGGGVVGDMAGFAASTYMRGIRYVQVPTTLLSQVDSSVGGKTGVDFGKKKNLIGAFYHPLLVYINVDTLKTLSESQYRSGLGEVIKYGVMGNNKFYQYIKENITNINNKDIETIIELVKRSCEDKAYIVKMDEKETAGMREFLNFGHTIGHAIETYLNFKYPHGICVSMGMVGATYISYLKGYINIELYEDVVAVLKGLEMLPKEKVSFEYNEIINLIKYDKKTLNGNMRFVLLETLGKTKIDAGVLEEEIENSLKKIEEVF